jgi:hypothetical protein
MTKRRLSEAQIHDMLQSSTESTPAALIYKSNQIKSTLFRQGSHVSSEELVSM